RKIQQEIVDREIDGSVHSKARSTEPGGELVEILLPSRARAQPRRQGIITQRELQARQSHEWSSTVSTSQATPSPGSINVRAASLASLRITSRSLNTASSNAASSRARVA